MTDLEPLHQGLRLAGLGGEDMLGPGEIIEHLGGQPEGGDPDPETIAEVAQGVGQGLVLDGTGIE